jgi:hypothetical protein
MAAEIVQEQDVAAGKPAMLRPLTVYKGAPAKTYAMSLPRSDGVIITEGYAGFSGKPGERRFVVLHQGSRGFETDPCEGYLLENSAIKAAVIRKTVH